MYLSPRITRVIDTARIQVGLIKQHIVDTEHTGVAPDIVSIAIINMKYIICLIALSLTSCVTNWERNRKLNKEIFEEYLVKPNLARSMMGQDGPVCSTFESVK
jgi:hypothetical protein